jgi:hypothetical protein
LTATCGECHPEVAREVAQSVHGQALAKGRREPPSCLDCHAEHQIQALKTQSSLRISEEVCSRSHASERMNTKYNLPRDRVRAFFESYHGLAIQLGSTRAANCASCHGVQTILPSKDPRSSIHKDNLQQTCGRCHVGATANFVAGRVHFDDTAADDIVSRVNRWVRRLYVGLIPGVVGAMAVHNGLAWRKKVLASFRSPDRTRLRMDRSQRLQQLVLLTSFILLAVTGFVLAYPHSWFAILLGSDEGFRRWRHRLAGVVLLAVGVYHGFYVVATQEERRLLPDLTPVARPARRPRQLALLIKPGPAQAAF